MRKKKNKTENRDLERKLRDEAEEKLAQSPGAPGEMQEKNPEELLHELRVHQIELEMQNDELRKAQLALEESRQRYSDLYDFAPVGYFSFSPEALIKEVNLTGATLMGVARQKLINRRFRSFIAPSDLDLWDQYFLSVLQHEEKQTCDLMLKRQDGSTFYAGLESIRMEVSWEAAEVHTVVTDITARKKAEEGLRLHEALYSGFINSMNSGVAVYRGNEDGSDFVFVDFNKAGEKIDKVKKEDLLGKSVLEMFPKIKEFGLFEIFQRVWKTGMPERHSETFYLDQRIGGWRENYVYKLPSGEIVALYDDITERVQAEMLLRESEEKYRSLASTADSMYLVDRKCRYLFMNEKHLERFDLRGAQIIGRMYSEFHSEEDTREFAQKVKEVFDTNKSIQSEHKSERDKRYFLRTYSPVKDQDGKAIMAVTVVSKDITERKRAEEELKKSLQLLSDTGKMAEVGGWELDLSTQEVSWTEEVGWIHGVEPGYRPKLEEALNFYAPKSRPVVEEALKKAAETGEPYDLESLFIPRGGKDKIWVRSLGRAVYSGDKIVKLTGTFQNIDKYKKAEEALRKSEEKFRNLFDNAVEGVFQATPEGRLLTANRAFARMFGYESPEEIINTVTDTARQLFANPADRETIVGTLKETGYLKNFECQMCRKDGRIFWGSFNSRFTITVDGISCFEGFMIDITERKQLEEVIRQSEERYRTVIEEIEEGYYEVDLAGNFTFVNDAMIRHFQYSRGELIGMNYRTYVPREEVKGVYKAFNRVFQTGEIIKWYPATNIRKDGKLIFVEDSISCRRDGEGRIIGFRGICRDVSERKRAEDRIWTSLREKEVLLREIHHRVKNNLQVVQSLLNLQARKIKDPQALEVFKQSRDRIRAMSLVHEKLCQSPDLAQIDMADYLRNLSISLFHSYQVNPDTVNLKVEVEEVRVGIDKAVPLGLIVNELISNGLKHAFPGGKMGEIRVRLALVDEGMIRLTVGDNGVGFSRDVDFRKTDSMGFQVVMALVQQLGGTIGYHQEVGTEFRVTFPRKYNYEN